MIKNLFQPLERDLLQHSHDDFRSCPQEFGTYSFEHLDLFFEDNFQPPLCSNFDEGEEMVFLKQDFCDKNFQPPLLSSFHSTTYMVGGFYNDGHPPIIQRCFQPLACCRPS